MIYYEIIMYSYNFCPNRISDDMCIKVTIQNVVQLDNEILRELRKQNLHSKYNNIFIVNIVNMFISIFLI